MNYYTTIHRILQTDFDEDEVVEENDDELIVNDDDYYSNDGARPLLFVVPCFTFWNLAVGSRVALAISFLFLRGKFHRSCIVLLCPHWPVGILVPAYVAYHWRGVWGCALAVLITTVLPYGIFLIYHARTNEELRRIPLLCGCFTTSTSNVAEGAASEQHVETPGLELPKISEGVIKNPEECLIFKKVLPAEEGLTFETSSNTTTTTDDENDSEYAASSSFRINNPKSDIFARPTRTTTLSTSTQDDDDDDDNDDHESPTTTIATTSTMSSSSMRLCAICLEEYKAGEDIAWSRNPNCHHVYHKDCVLELLKGKHQECPICREPYYMNIVTTALEEEEELGAGVGNSSSPSSATSALDAEEV